MNIAFNLLNCGLGNNGGSQTIIRMADELYMLGHSVKILLNQPNKFTWFDIPNDLISYEGDVTPEFDVMIATGCSTVESTIKYNKLPMSRKFYWIRAIETWAQTLEELIHGYSSGLGLIVNSEWQRRFIWKHTNLVPNLVYSGLPLRMISDKIYGMSKYKMFSDECDKVIVGALASKKSRKRFSDVIDIAYKLTHEGLLDELVLIGNEDFEKIKSIFGFTNLSGLNIRYLKQPHMDDKLKAMLNCDVWLSTTVNEGLHIPPLEAALCGCFLVSRDKEESGLSDYSIDNYTSFNYLSNNDAAIKIGKFMGLSKTEKIYFSDRISHIMFHKIGSVSENAKRMIKVIGNGS